MYNSEKKQEEKRNTKTAMEAAAAYLANRMHTAFEVRRHLKDKGYTQDEISTAIDELLEMHYLDDYRYALSYFEYNREKKRGSLRAERELAEKGVDRETIRNAKEDFLFEQEVDEFEDALAAARGEVFTKKDIFGDEVEVRELDDKLSAKIARKLESKGFSRGDIFRVLDALRREAREAHGE